ncbi:MAG TPA: hypothetical protein DFS52_00680 [Myxococcales bacterium]|jgi:hypothetical protein|nr:hypothetical protein [Myxococcales bacterium]
MKHVMAFRRAGEVHAVLALVALDDATLDGDAFARQRDIVRAVAHYIATHLNPLSLADSAHVWAVGPTGKQDDSAWRHLRQDLHQDSWSVPKSLWLPGHPPDATEFLDQGFLATPWEGEPGGQVESLDLIDRFAKKLGSRKAPWQRDRVRQVLDSLGGGQTAADAVADSLIHLAEESR